MIGGEERCPRCGEPRIGPFCEGCGHRYAAVPSPDPSPASSSDPSPAWSWCAVVAPDREYFTAAGFDTGRFSFPARSAARRVPLTSSPVRIGRRSRRRGSTPDIDLADPPADPGVSHNHALLLARPDGTWALVDQGSTNGTYLNGGTDRISRDQEVPLAAGDRFHLGVWTTITVHPDRP